MHLNSAFLRHKRARLLVLAVFGVVYALVFVPNHLLFRSYALDLGLYTHAAITYAHGHMADCMLFLGSHQLLLADHFDLHLILWSPLTWLFGQWTLLIVQWVAVLLGGLGMWRWLRALGASNTIATLGMVHFLAFFGIYGAFTFDFHSNVVATMALPWYGLALQQHRRRALWLLLLFMLAAKENMGIWLCAVCVGFAWHYRKDPRLRNLLLLQALLALAWSTVVIGTVMPALSDGGTYANWKYPALGSGPLDALRIIASRPMDVFEALLDGRGFPSGHAIKVEMLVLLFFAGGWAMLLRPWILLMAVPLLLQKLLHAGPAQWGVLAQYSVEFAPLCTLAIFSWPPLLRERRWSNALAGVAALLSVAVTVRVLDASIFKENRPKQRFYQVEHYERDYDARAVRELLASIPADVSVSASAPFVPHLVRHVNLYQYPIIDKADAIVLATLEWPYPETLEDLHTACDSLRHSRYWKLERECDGAVLFRKVRSLP
ncbi:MAG: DUF2079 domain-containing protein [Flavobacteriales bacterium]